MKQIKLEWTKDESRILNQLSTNNKKELRKILMATNYMAVKKFLSDRQLIDCNQFNYQYTVLNEDRES